MTHPRPETVQAIHALAKDAVEEMGGTYDESVGIHINWSESDDYQRGFNAGYDCADTGHPGTCSGDATAPTDDPWRDAYLRGFAEGIAQITDGLDENDVRLGTCPDCLGTGSIGTFDEIPYTLPDGTTGVGTGFVEKDCPTCNATGDVP